jgi:hypothetical protein
VRGECAAPPARGRYGAKDAAGAGDAAGSPVDHPDPRPFAAGAPPRGGRRRSLGRLRSRSRLARPEAAAESGPCGRAAGARGPWPAWGGRGGCLGHRPRARRAPLAAHADRWRNRLVLAPIRIRRWAGSARAAGRRATDGRAISGRGADGSGWLPWKIGALTLGAAARYTARGRVLGRGGTRAGGNHMPSTRSSAPQAACVSARVRCGRTPGGAARAAAGGGQRAEGAHGAADAHCSRCIEDAWGHEDAWRLCDAADTTRRFKSSQQALHISFAANSTMLIHLRPAHRRLGLAAAHYTHTRTHPHTQPPTPPTTHATLRPSPITLVLSPLR